MRGRKPKPTPLKILTGNPGGRPLNDREPKPRRGRPRCPSFLSDGAKREWARLVPELDRLGLLTLVDSGALAAYCQSWDEFRLATKTLNKEGRTCTAGNGGLKSHPAVVQQRTAWKGIQAFAALFGLDPSSRVRLKVPQEEADPLAAFLEPEAEQS
jgi:P27 family predicted phage terminase small subunit